MHRLFVYGTLAPGRPNAHVLAGVEGEWEEGTVRGDLVERGWGATAGYPALVLRPDASEVAGFVLSSDALDGEWQRLDEFEGPGYERVLAPGHALVGGGRGGLVVRRARGDVVAGRGRGAGGRDP